MGDTERYAIISDIHGNLPALKAVLRDIEQIGDIKEIWCLGDIVGYGPYPLECIHLTEKYCRIIIQGNHERALVEGGGARFNARALRAIDWTRATIAAAPQGADILQRLTSRENSFERKGLLYVHGSPVDPTEEYLMPRDAARGAKINPQFDRFRRYAFVGHTHFPGVIEMGDPTFKPPATMASMMLGSPTYMLDDNAKAIINVGSVGQPRDGNPRACYVIYEWESDQFYSGGRVVERPIETVAYRRVAYNVEATRSRIFEIPALDRSLGERLLVGK